VIFWTIVFIDEIWHAACNIMGMMYVNDEKLTI